jgi:pimeloyl-ACP methyl ester carboxylesterase
VAENVTTAVVEDAGHWVSDENPEALTQILLNFFDELPADPSPNQETTHA